MPPLDGITVVDLTRVLAGPFCTMLLADMGAEVIKIEEPTQGDEMRTWAPTVSGLSTYFLGVNRGKKSVAIDLRTDEGLAFVRDLIAGADVLIENFRPGALIRLGLGYEELSARHPGLIYCSISGYGQNGPSAHLPGYDIVIQGESGLMEVTGSPDGEPSRVGIAVADYFAGLYAHQGILLALIERQKSGLGQRVDVALFDGLMSVMHLPLANLIATGASPTRIGNVSASITPYEPFRVRDGRVIVAAGNPGLWRQFCEAIDQPALADDPRFVTNRDRIRNRQAFNEALAPILGALTVDDLIARLRARQVPCGRVRSFVDALNDPQVQARNMVSTLDHPVEGTFPSLGNPVKLSRTPARIGGRPPRLGEHTEEVKREKKEAREMRGGHL